MTELKGCVHLKRGNFNFKHSLFLKSFNIIELQCMQHEVTPNTKKNQI